MGRLACLAVAFAAAVSALTSASSDGTCENDGCAATMRAHLAQHEKQLGCDGVEARLSEARGQLSTTTTAALAALQAKVDEAEDILAACEGLRLRAANFEALTTEQQAATVARLKALRRAAGATVPGTEYLRDSAAAAADGENGRVLVSPSPPGGAPDASLVVNKSASPAQQNPKRPQRQSRTPLAKNATDGSPTATGSDTVEDEDGSGR